MATPKDVKLYERIRKRLYKRMSHSVYRSALLVKEYKTAYKLKYGSANAYVGKKPTKRSGLKRWLAEEWRNQRGEVGYKYKSDVYRPTKRVTTKTPITFNELTKSELRVARSRKRRTGRVKRFIHE